MLGVMEGIRCGRGVGILVQDGAVDSVIGGRDMAAVREERLVDLVEEHLLTRQGHDVFL